MGEVTVPLVCVVGNACERGVRRVDGGRWATGSGRWAVDRSSGRSAETLGVGSWAVVGRGPWNMGGGCWVVDGGWWVVGRGRWVVGGGW